MTITSQLTLFGWILVVLTWIIRWQVKIHEKENSEWRKLYYTSLVVSLLCFISSLVIDYLHRS
jgi:hypothetical protein